MDLRIPEEFDHGLMIRIYNSFALTCYPLLPANLKIEQAEGIHALLVSRDLLLICPTAFGKSLVYTVPGIIKSKMKKVNTITIVIAPLVALMNNAMSKLSFYNLKSNHVTSENEMNSFLQRIESEPVVQPYFIFISPEVLIKKAMKQQITKISPDFIIVDEGHVAAEWSENFRKDYGSIYEIRASTACPLGVFTATLTTHLVQEVRLKTGMRPSNTHLTAISADRPNIFLSLRNPKSRWDYLTELAEEIRNHKTQTAKTLIFVTSVPSTSELYLWFRSKLGNDAIMMTGQDTVQRIIDFYSSETEIKAKQQIEDEFGKTDGYLRILISTVAFGLGVDITNIRRVVVWGTPSTAMMLWQEIGRSGRDGDHAEAIIFPFSSPGKFGNENLLIDSGVCMREQILKQFFMENRLHRADKGIHCCSYCESIVPSAGESSICARIFGTS